MANPSDSEYSRLPSELLDLQALYGWAYDPADSPILWENTEEKTRNGSWTTVKSLTIPDNIVKTMFRVTFQMKISSTAYAARGRIIVGGKQRGDIFQTQSVDYVTLTQDIGYFTKGEYVEIQLSSNWTGVTAYLKTTRFKGELKQQRVNIDPPSWS